ncbi:Cys-tRNA(Pro) deacylase [Sporosarcina sp. PTS2304]|uniref:Cys-tRNA(Pro) deacylase n=1 Tax=Sporosarcina sp. PTS2304 TaxID=2283194 RepID=UPI000E0D926B|nr:Cys-tRNA(Pro) deacylase [Sporosarcina sp. PTS2304]AXI01054.1 Cys-tRNA(Pro) deacylase [Sporosarcina sp. PTS2304]
MAKKQKSIKTNAIRILESEKIPHEMRSYDIEDGHNDGQSVAHKTNESPEHVYKTLVAMAGKTERFVFILPVTAELDLKKAAKAAQCKKIEMLPMKELTKETGYVRGGCSPVGMKKDFPTFIDRQAEVLEYLLVSAGKIGLQMKVAPKDLAYITKAEFADLIKN